MVLKYLCVFSCLTFPVVAFTQPKTKDTAKINQIEVTAVEVMPIKEKKLPHQTLANINGLQINAAKRTELIVLNNSEVNTAENNPRQVFAKIPGINVWEMDGTGNQVSIATRGLNPHRSWELNVRQNGFILNSDLFGYPEAHYNPPLQAVERIEFVRGAGALQYGQQFGGMLNYILKEGDTTKPIAVETHQTIGSFGLFSSYTAIGGTKGNWQYYAYYNNRSSNGWRENSDYRFDAWHIGVNYFATKKVKIHVEVSHMEYVNHFGAGLTDSMFTVNPRQSNRNRNYFNPDMYVQGLRLDWKINNHLKFQLSASAILGQRNSVQFIDIPTVEDTLPPRIVDRDYYNSYSAEAKLLYQYKVLKRKHTIAAGVRVVNNTTLRSQRGWGSTKALFDLSLTAPYQLDIKFKTQAYGAFAENIFNLSKKLLLTIGARYESNITNMQGKYFNFRAEDIPVNLDRNIAQAGLGIEYKLSETVKVFANYAQGYRPVIYSDILPHTPLDKVDNNIKDAFGSNSEIGISGNLKKILQFNITAFNMVYNNRIGKLVLTENGNTFFLRTNTGNTLAQGVELFVEFYPMNWGISKTKETHNLLDFSVYSSTMYNNAVYTEGKLAKSKTELVDITGNKLENAPQLISRNGAKISYKKALLTLQVSHVSETYTDALNTENSTTGVNGIVPAYTLADINASYIINKNLTAKVAINNLLNKMYFTRRATGYPGPGLLPSDGRSVTFTVSAFL
jgi:Fe(3+) dicitrate transport protein